MKFSYKSILQLIWSVLVGTFILVYLYRHHETLMSSLRIMSWSNLVIAFVLIFFAKIGLTLNMQLASTQYQISICWLECFRLYNLTQLGKYIPGFIWQFVGRISVMKSCGIAGNLIRDALLAEHFWVLLIACCVGMALLIITHKTDSANNIFFTTANHWFTSLLLAGTLLFLSGMFLIWQYRNRFSVLIHWLIKIFPPFPAIFFLIVTWLLLGASMSVLISPTLDLSNFLYIIAVYCIAYILGFLAPFAPAGLGVREAIIVGALLPVVGYELSVFFAGVNRIIYFTVELLLAAVALFIPTTPITVT